MGVFVRGTRYYIELPDGRQRSTGLLAAPENRPAAEQILQEVLDGLADGGVPRRTPSRAQTVRDYFSSWIAEQSYATVRDDSTRLERHAMPLIGDVPLSEIHPRHVRELVDRLKAKIPTNELAPRSVRHVYEALKRMLQRAVDDELLIRNPCNLRKNELPAKVDKNPSWRPNARFDRAEVQVLMSCAFRKFCRRFSRNSGHNRVLLTLVLESLSRQVFRAYGWAVEAEQATALEDAVDDGLREVLVV